MLDFVFFECGEVAGIGNGFMAKIEIKWELNSFLWIRKTTMVVVIMSENKTNTYKNMAKI